MKLFVLRHGDAALAAASDCQRPLTSRGRSQTRALIADRRPQLSAIERVFCSPKLRAQQTGEIACELLDLADAINLELLTPCGDLQQLGEFVNRQRADSMLLVSHQPLVGELIEYLTDSDNLARQMGTSCLAALELLAFVRGGATLEWLAQPQ